MKPDGCSFIVAGSLQLSMRYTISSSQESAVILDAAHHISQAGLKCDWEAHPASSEEQMQAVVLGTAVIKDRHQDQP